jgi:hypothetical protein
MRTAMHKTVTRISFLLYSNIKMKPSMAMNKRHLRVPLIPGVAGAEVCVGSGIGLDSV